MLVVMGYDRPLNEFFLQLWDDGPGADADEPAYSSLDEPAADWRDIATVVRRLEELGVRGAALDDRRGRRRRRAGNRIVEHTTNGSATTISD